MNSHRCDNRTAVPNTRSLTEFHAGLLSKSPARGGQLTRQPGSVEQRRLVSGFKVKPVGEPKMG